jgi:hypothetical protein
LQANQIAERPTADNMVRWCLGARLFGVMESKYYYDIGLFFGACKKLNICSRDDYVRSHIIDPMLPPIEYLNNGFYCDLYPQFNLQSLGDATRQETDQDI